MKLYQQINNQSFNMKCGFNVIKKEQLFLH